MEVTPACRPIGRDSHSCQSQRNRLDLQTGIRHLCRNVLGLESSVSGPHKRGFKRTTTLLCRPFLFICIQRERTGMVTSKHGIFCPLSNRSIVRISPNRIHFFRLYWGYKVYYLLKDRKKIASSCRDLF